MQVLGGFLALGGVGFGCACLMCGLANTLDWLAYRLHRVARELRELHGRRAAELSERWIRELQH